MVKVNKGLQTCRTMSFDDNAGKMTSYKTYNMKANSSERDEKHRHLSDSSQGFYSHSLLKPADLRHFSLLITVFVIHHGGEAHL